MIKLASQLRLPEDAVSETFAILGKRGAGKSNTAVVCGSGNLITVAGVVVVDYHERWDC